jgi:hypothetical protein
MFRRVDMSHPRRCSAALLNKLHEGPEEGTMVFHYKIIRAIPFN